jgi:hypothetical protein
MFDDGVYSSRSNDAVLENAQRFWNPAEIRPEVSVGVA